MRLPLVLVPDPDEPGTAAIVVSGQIEQSERLFLLDTGAARTSIVRDELTADLPAVGLYDSEAVFGPETAEAVTVGELSVGPVSLEGLEVCLVPPGSPRQENLLGIDVISRANWRLSFSEGHLEIETAPLCGRGGRLLVCYEHGQPAVELDFGAVRASAVWDSGAGMTVVDTGFFERYPRLFEVIGSATGTDAAGNSLESAVAVMAPCTLGGCELPSSKVAIVDLASVAATTDRPLEMIVGYTTYHHADWIFDFLQGTYEVRPRATHGSFAPPPTDKRGDH